MQIITPEQRRTSIKLRNLDCTTAMAETSVTSSAPSVLPLNGRVAIITGASRGIGREIALHLASLGASLILNYTSPSSAALANDLAAQINNSTTASSSAPRAFSFQADISDPRQVELLFDQPHLRFGRPPHIAVNSAGVLDPAYPTVSATPLESFDNTFNVNARGAFLVAKEASNRVVRGGGGRIVLLSSSMVGGLKEGFGAYAASKAAVETMAKILAKELKGTMITVNCVAPGPVATEMFFAGKSEETVRKIAEESPLGRIGETADVASVVGFLATDGGGWINGQVIRVNGGYV